MCTVRAIPFMAMGIGLSISTCYAGPCSGAIDKMQARIDSALEEKAAGGPVAKEGAIAGMSQQLTPRSIAAAEEKLGELSPQTVDAVRRAMAKARAADSAGDGRRLRKRARRSAASQQPRSITSKWTRTRI